MKKILTILLAVIIAFSSITGATVVEAASKNTIKTSISKIEGKAKGFKVTWKKKGKIKGYQIQYSTSSKFKKSSTKTKTISKAKTVSTSISKLKGCNKKYYVRVRTYKVSKGKKVYSAWSKAKKVTTLKHKYSKATCKKAKVCKYCKKTVGKKKAHNYNKGVCSRCGNKDSNYIEYVTIPNFVGLSKNGAEKLATSLGLKIAFITDTYSPEYKDNVIVKQSSEKDVLMTKGATITLSVNNCVYKYFNFKIIDGTVTVSNRLFGGAVPDDDSALPYMENDTYVIVSLNKEDLPSTLIIPETYNGKRITAIQRGLLGDCKVKTVILPKTIKAIGGNFCGSGCTCPSLEKLILTNTTPCYLGSLAFTGAQLSGGCKIYVPDESVEKYKSSEIGDLSGFPFKTYADLIFPISSLDEATKNLIS